MNDVFIGVASMIILGSAPALMSLLPKQGDDIAIIPIFGADHDAALRVAVASEGQIMRVSDKTGAVVLRTINIEAISRHQFTNRVLIMRSRVSACQSST